MIKNHFSSFGLVAKTLVYGAKHPGFESWSRRPTSYLILWMFWTLKIALLSNSTETTDSSTLLSLYVEKIPTFSFHIMRKTAVSLKIDIHQNHTTLTNFVQYFRLRSYSIFLFIPQKSTNSHRDLKSLLRSLYLRSRPVSTVPDNGLAELYKPSGI